MLEEVRSYISEQRMVMPRDLVIVAVSGGPDSVALLHVLTTLRTDLQIDLHVFHMNHGLRGPESAKDAEYVRHLSDQWGLPCTVVALQEGSLKHKGGSLQANARAVRMSEIRTLARRIGATRVALGHNRDDQAETVLMRLLRGAGTTGLAGIRPTRVIGDIVFLRPLLNIPRIDIENYCRASELSPRLDQSNLKPDYTRNRIRLGLLPQIAHEYNPAIRKSLAQVAEVCGPEDDFMEASATEALVRCRVPGDSTGLVGSALLKEPLAVARRALRLAARQTEPSQYDLGLSSITQILQVLAQSNGTHTLMLPEGLTVVVEYGICRFLAPDDSVPAHQLAEWDIHMQGETRIAELGLRVQVAADGSASGISEALFDVDRLPGPLAMRLRRPGDRMWPVGMEGSKKLQDILVDAKVPRRLRDRVPLLVSGGEILWAVGYRLDRRFLASPKSVEVVYVQIQSESIEP